jgi:putative lipase involved disintegration of autophagic bodies
MFRLTCIIEIGKFEFNFVTEIEINKSWKTLTDTCKITLPRNIEWEDSNLRDELKKGDIVNIYFNTFAIVEE